MPNACRLLYDPPATGAWNMAVDEALLQTAAAGGPPTLRFYTWSEPTLSLGYFQAAGDRQGHVASRDLPIVRRPSGGGALVHHHELTYSLALPPEAEGSDDAVRLTCLAHQALIEAIREVARGESEGGPGLTTCAAAIPPESGVEPFLCFQRRSQGDLLASAPGTDIAHKVCGSAQRKRRGALLQHGGALLRRTEFAPELPGVSDLGGADAGADKLAAAWGRKLLSRLGLTARRDSLAAADREAATDLAERRFGSADWTNRR